MSNCQIFILFCSFSVEILTLGESPLALDPKPAMSSLPSRDFGCICVSESQHLALVKGEITAFKVSEDILFSCPY